MAESRVATLQGKNIGRLTRVTVVGKSPIFIVKCSLLKRLDLFTSEPGHSE